MTGGGDEARFLDTAQNDTGEGRNSLASALRDASTAGHPHHPVLRRGWETSSPCQPAAVDGEDGAVEVGGGVGGEEDDGTLQVGGLAPAAGGDAGED